MFIRLLLIFVMFVVFVESDDNFSLGFQINEEFLAIDDPHKPIPKNCYLTERENCELSQMDFGERYQIYPGGFSKCIDSSPYFFSVIRGKSDKVLYYLQGGGICVDTFTLSNNFCITSATLLTSGIFNLRNESNPFREYTIITTHYCSGDLHLCNLSSSFKDIHGIYVPQVGAQNANAVLSWTMKQQKDGDIDHMLSKLVIAGSSAGGIGLQVWSRKVLSSINTQSSVVLIDAGIDITSKYVEAVLLNNYGTCHFADLIPATYQIQCLTSSLSIQELFLYTMSSYPRTVFAFVQSLADLVVIQFYNLQVFYYGTAFGLHTIANTMEFGKIANQTLTILNNAPNFIAYLVVPSNHGFFYKNLFYTTNTSSLYNGNKSPSSLLNWITTLVSRNGEVISTECSGIYCHHPLYPKSIVLSKKGKLKPKPRPDVS